MSEYGSYRIGNKAIGITKFPDRKQPALFVQEKTVIYPIAYMKEEKAEMLWKWLRKFVGREEVEINLCARMEASDD
jgi:hypothetical protein